MRGESLNYEQRARDKEREGRGEGETERVRTGKIGKGNWVQTSVDVDDVAATPEVGRMDDVYVGMGCCFGLSSERKPEENIIIVAGWSRQD